jgi:hypothetical protein
MYTTFAYYPSPIDGNLYPIYIFINDQLAPVHFIYINERLALAYYPNSGWSQSPAILIQCATHNGYSNLVYYQPKPYGQMELLYCTTSMNGAMQLFINSQYQQFDGITIMPNEIPATNNRHLPRYVEEQVVRMPVHTNPNIPDEIINALQAVQYGQLSNVSLNSNQHGFHLTAEDFTGNRIIIEKYESNGISRKSVTEIDTPNQKAERQTQVLQLRQEGRTQAQIANHLGVSQKTISNDLKELKN